MKRRKKQQEMDDVEMDMTPMIDVVFNLIIFFMLVTQMVTIERAELELPIASQAIEERNPDKQSLIINIHKEPDKRFEVAGQIVAWPDLVKLLFNESKISRNNEGLSTRAVMIRADIDAPYEIIQKVMMQCAKQKLYKLSFCAKLDSN